MESLVRNATSKLPDQQHKRANVNHVLSGRGPFCQVLSPICAGAALAPGLLVLRLLVQIWLHAFTRLCSWPVSLLTKFPFPSIAWRGCGERERERKKSLRLRAWLWGFTLKPGDLATSTCPVHVEQIYRVDSIKSSIFASAVGFIWGKVMSMCINGTIYYKRHSNIYKCISYPTGPFSRNTVFCEILFIYCWCRFLDEIQYLMRMWHFSNAIVFGGKSVSLPGKTTFYIYPGCLLG